MTKIYALFFLVAIVLFSCNSDEGLERTEPAVVFKPKGIFTSSFGNPMALENHQVKGALIRVKWSDIEPVKDEFDFSKIEAYKEIIKTKGLKWSLGVIAGGDSPIG